MVLSIAADITEGMAYLHSKGVVHADLKASNVLLKTVTFEGLQRVVAKVSDMGTSMLLKGQKEIKNFYAGTPTHMAPEVIATNTLSQVPKANVLDGPFRRQQPLFVPCFPPPQQECAGRQGLGKSWCGLRERAWKLENLCGWTAGGEPCNALAVTAVTRCLQASDVYSFGIMLFELASGQRPYASSSTEDILHNVVHHSLRPALTVDAPR